MPGLGQRSSARQGREINSKQTQNSVVLAILVNRQNKMLKAIYFETFIEIF